MKREVNTSKQNDNPKGRKRFTMKNYILYEAQDNVMSICKKQAQMSHLAVIAPAIL